MRPKSLMLLILALGCGLVAAVGINQVMANRGGQRSGPSGETTPIFVALTDIGLGDPLTPEMLKLEEWPKGKAPPGALARLEDIEGRRTRSRFFPGEPIIEAKLFAKGDDGAGATDLIPKGMRVVAVRVDSVSGSGLILPGDRVDVLVHFKASHGQTGRTATKTFLQNVRVFAVNDVYDRADNGETAITAKTISLLVSPQQAELVTLANEMGKLRLVMRSPNDEEHEETLGVTPDELFEGSGMAANKPGDDKSSSPTDAAMDLLSILNQNPTPLPANETAPPPPDSFTMVLIEGNGVREVEFVEGDRVGQTKKSYSDQPADDPATTTPPPAPNPALDLLGPAGGQDPLAAPPTLDAPPMDDEPLSDGPSE